MYADRYTINKWLSDGKLFCFPCKDSFFILRENVKFYNLYFFSSSLEALNVSLDEFNNKIQVTTVADIIGASLDDERCSMFIRHSFWEYTTLNRMSMALGDYVEKRESNVRGSTLKDLDAVYDLLYTYFDPLAEQLPDHEKLKEWSECNNIIIKSTEEGKIGGFLIFELIGKTSYLRYWFVHPSCRGMKLGSDLIREYLWRSRQAERSIFWVRTSNINAIDKYRKYGYKDENVFDHILINKKMKYEERNH